MTALPSRVPRLYHKADSARGSDYARTVTVELSVVETWEEHARDIDHAQSGLVEKVGKIIGGHQVMTRIAETSWGYDHHSCSTDDETRNHAK